ncbi:hypothetical protein Tco_0180053 [Tanacetum coccineum]
MTRWWWHGVAAAAARKGGEMARVGGSHGVGWRCCRGGEDGGYGVMGVVWIDVACWVRAWDGDDVTVSWTAVACGIRPKGGWWAWTASGEGDAGSWGHEDNIWFWPERSSENFSGGGSMVAGGGRIFLGEREIVVVCEWD